MNSTHCRICMKELHSPSGYDAVNVELVAIGKSEILALILIKTDSVQSSSNYLQKSFTKNLLTAR